MITDYSSLLGNSVQYYCEGLSSASTEHSDSLCQMAVVIRAFEHSGLLCRCLEALVLGAVS